MKIITPRNLLLVGAFGALAFSAKFATADSVTNSAVADAPSCCSDSRITTTIADTNTTDSAKIKAKPDLLKTCPVSGDKLGEMGDPFKFVYKGQEVKLCCSGCKKDFLKDPEKYITKIRKADKTAETPAKN